MRGFVPTPPAMVDEMVALLFRARAPMPESKVLDPGCGTGALIDGIIRWCAVRGLALPRVTGVESDPRHLPELRAKYAGHSAISIVQADFLAGDGGRHDYVISNPPYVAITALSDEEKTRYRAKYATARGRFDLYMLFFEQAMRALAPGGRLVFITPEKFIYVDTAGPLRELLAKGHVEEVRLVDESTFAGLVTYPTITVYAHQAPGMTRVRRRDGRSLTIALPTGSASWLPLLEGDDTLAPAATLADVCLRISCGVATGADSVFVRPLAGLDPALRRFAHPTVAGRELTATATELPRRHVMLIPYDTDRRLLPLEQLGALARYLAEGQIHGRLLARTCARRKPWYAFHETPVLRDVLRPKILCKDIGEQPRFWVDRSGQFVPRHSVYYIVPREPAALDVLVAYLRSPAASEWLRRHCQRAANGFLRLQSHTLQQLPLPADVALAAGAVPARLPHTMRHHPELPMRG